MAHDAIRNGARRNTHWRETHWRETQWRTTQWRTTQWRTTQWRTTQWRTTQWRTTQYAMGSNHQYAIHNTQYVICNSHPSPNTQYAIRNTQFTSKRQYAMRNTQYARYAPRRAPSGYAHTPIRPYAIRNAAQAGTVVRNTQYAIRKPCQTVLRNTQKAASIRNWSIRCVSCISLPAGTSLFSKGCSRRNSRLAGHEVSISPQAYRRPACLPIVHIYCAVVVAIVVESTKGFEYYCSTPR